jgi:hypothetical protein
MKSSGNLLGAVFLQVSNMATASFDSGITRRLPCVFGVVNYAVINSLLN